MKLTISLISLVLAIPTLTQAFCGFYVAKADTKLFNQASKVVIVREGNRTVLTMANDFQGASKEFAMVIPVPTFLEKDQIHVSDNKTIAHLDAYTSPRLVEYFDEDPCAPDVLYDSFGGGGFDDFGADFGGADDEDKSLGITIEAEYTIGEYDILILSAKESDGLETWLKQNDYKIPEGASEVLASYIKQKMRFFVAKVNLKEQQALGFDYLRPLQVAYESPKFGLPIRLGTINAKGDQELFAFVLTKNGRVETTNYKTVKLPSNMDLPLYIKDDFSDFYLDMFETQVQKHKRKAVFLEYAWDMAWCDPCAADPLSQDELKELGVFWLEGKQNNQQAQKVFVTRLHVRYSAETFPEDLVFQQTSDKENFQARYVLNHPWTKKANCAEGRKYFVNLKKRRETEAQTLVKLTGWKIEEVRKRMGIEAPKAGGKWYQKLWKK